jgi:hypothetical protein
MFRPYPITTMPDAHVDAINAEPWCHADGCGFTTSLTVVEQGRGRRKQLVVLCRGHADQHRAREAGNG